VIENDDAEIGVALCGFGALFTLFGVVMFFNNGLMAIGNVGPLFSPPGMCCCCLIRSIVSACSYSSSSA
jgi:hypothetical protein